jgi:hypothetical protein
MGGFIVVLVLRVAGCRHVEQLNFRSHHRDPVARHHDDLVSGPMNASVSPVGPGPVYDGLGEEIELHAVGACLELERRRPDLVAIPSPPTRAGWVEAPQLPTLGQNGEHVPLIASADDHLDVVMLTRVHPEPEVDRPATGDSPPSADPAHHVSNSSRIAHRDIVSPFPAKPSDKRVSAADSRLQQIGVGDSGKFAPDELVEIGEACFECVVDRRGWCERWACGEACLRSGGVRPAGRLTPGVDVDHQRSHLSICQSVTNAL